MRRPSNALLLWLGCCTFVVYGSLVPLDFRPHALDEAWRIFQRAPVLQIGAEHRADWISNIVLFVPVGFLTAHELMHAWPRLPRGVLLLVAGAFSFALAVAIEFTQIFFPPRTVDLNDIFAETVGSLIGLGLAARYSTWFAAALRAGPLVTRRIDSRWLVLYGLGYLAFSLFPFDFVLSMAELQSKVDSSAWGWILAGRWQGAVLVVLKLVAELVLTLPIGWWFAATARRPMSLTRAAAVGALLGLGIELTQFFMLSGISEGLSVVTRAAGVALGAALWQHRSRWTVASLAPLLRRHAVWLGALYAFVLLEVNHEFSLSWHGARAALQQLTDVHFLPFYYHYYTTEQAALASLVAVCLLYAPVGVGAWAARRGGVLAGSLAFGVSAAIETGKLFQLAHPDPTNVLIASVAAWVAHALFKALERGAETQLIDEPRQVVAFSAPKGTAAGRLALPVRHNTLARVVWLPAIVLAAWSVARFPVLPGLLGALLAGAAYVVWQRPALVFLIVPAALPVLDLAPWSGRIYIDEFDLLLLVTLATGCLRTPPRPANLRHPDPVLAAVTTLLALTFAIGVARGMLPWHGLEGVSIETFHGPLNALRIGKGALWALIACELWRRVAANGDDARRRLAVGIVAGLAMTVAVIVWERVTFAQLLDFAGDYRVTALFSAMHTGGAYIECFLVVATPFLMVLILQSRHWLNKLAGAALLTATAYALAVTFSRSGYAAFAVSASVVLVAWLRRRTPTTPRWALAIGLAALMLAATVPVLHGRFAQARAAATETDLQLRLRHWADVVAMRPEGWATQLFGTGLGRFPETYYWRHDTKSRAGTYHLYREAREPFLRLGSGDAIYVEQFLTIVPGRNYTLQLDARSAVPGAVLGISLCEKWLLSSFDCVQAEVNAGPKPNQWQSVEVKLNSGMLGGKPWYADRPVKLGLHNPTQALAFDVADLRLLDASGRSLLDNGDFAQGMDHWFFSADNHLPWHAKSLPVGVLFDLGWLGVVALGLLFGLATARGARAAWHGDMRSAAALAALTGFGMLGVFDTLIDEPRFLFVFLGLCALCAGANADDPTGAADA